MRIIFGLGHPAHFHLYKHVIRSLKKKHSILVVISDKDILKKLLDNEGIDYTVIAFSKEKETLVGKCWKLVRSTVKLLSIAIKFKPDLAVSCLSQLIWAARILNTPSIFTAEDDIHYTWLQGLITYPFVDTILTPSVVNVSPFTHKRIGYEGYHKLSYLHPSVFRPNQDICKKYIKDAQFFLLRIVNRAAYHDINASGLDIQTMKSIISVLEKKGRVLITSEAPLPSELQKYQLNINPSEIHHLLFFAQLFVGDSQSMTVESALLGTPNIRFNNFIGMISVLEELEHRYQLSFSISSKYPEKLESKVTQIVSEENLKHEWKMKRDLMLRDKINVSEFFTWFIDHYPASKKQLIKDPDYQFRFK